MEFTLTVTSSDPSELAKLLSGISGGSIAPATPARQPKKDKEEILKEGNITDTPGEEVKNPVTLEMLREKTAEKSQANKKDAIKKLLAEFNAVNVAALAKENWEEFIKPINDRMIKEGWRTEDNKI